MSKFLDLSQFTKQKKVGKGSYGEVFTVLKKGTKSILAAKISFTELNKDDPTLIANLKREVNNLSKINHPTILKFIGYSPIDFDQEPRPVIITEFSPNGSLNDMIELDRKGKAPESWTDTKVLINIYGISFAMLYLHSYNILHLDLKPANILLDENLYPKIADFGLSKTFHKKSDNSNDTSSMGIIGTPSYIAPEIWRDKKYTEKADVYAFAMIMYELLTLNEPFKNYNLFTLYSKVIENEERPDFVFPIPTPYRELIISCWSNNPDNRPSFSDIVYLLRNESEFITDSIDKDEFFDYVDLLDSVHSSFNSDKKLKTIVLTNKNLEKDENFEENQDDEIGERINENYEEEIGKISEIETDKKDKEDKYDIITIEEFNNFTIEKQYQTINNIIHKRGKKNKPSINKIHELLKYISTTKKKTDIKYLSIINENKKKNIEEHLESKIKICLSGEFIKLITEESTFSIISKYLKDMNNIFIELEYPSNTFEEIYSQALKLKEEDQPGIYLNIYINKINQTDYKFINNKHIYSIRIGKDVTEIPDDYFSESSIEQITFENLSSLTKIGENAFSDCKSLERITIPSSVIAIGKKAFTKCVSLIQFSIPSSVTEIKEQTFESCQSLVQFSIPSSITRIEKRAFNKCYSLIQVSFENPSSLTSIEGFAFNDCFSLKSITIPSSVTTIGECVFVNCELLRQFIIPSSVKQIKYSAFAGCKSLVKITFETPSSVTEIGQNAFEGCTSLKQITIPSSVISIKGSPYKNHNNLFNGLTVRSFGKNIKYGAFIGCESLEEIIFENPSSINSIEGGTFKQCNSLKRIVIPSSVTQICQGTFFQCSSLEQVIIPSSVTQIGQAAFSECTSLIKIIIPSSVKQIGEGAFYKCESLEEVLFESPSSIDSIKKCTFKLCKSLKKISIPSSVRQIDKDAFAGCSSLVSVPSLLNDYSSISPNKSKTIDENDE